MTLENKIKNQTSLISYNLIIQLENKIWDQLVSQVSREVQEQVFDQLKSNILRDMHLVKRELRRLEI